MEILGTGGAGFIGSHLCDTLVARGDRVVVLDDLSTGSIDNLSQHQNDGALRFRLGSVLDRSLVDRLVTRTDAVVHLASAVGVELIMDQPLRSIQTIIKGTEAVLDAARQRKTPVLLASTSEVYGKNPGVLHEDADRVLGPTSIPRWSYATAKAVDEYLAFGYFEEHGVPAVVLRFFNTVGPRQTGAYGMVLPRFVEQALRGEDLVVFGDGHQRRCFCHVADTVRAVVALLDAPEAAGSAFNIAASEETTIAGLAQLIVDITESSSKIRTIDPAERFGHRYEDIAWRRPETSRIQALTGWTSQRSLGAIIEDVVDSVASRRELFRVAAA